PPPALLDLEVEGRRRSRARLPSGLAPRRRTKVLASAEREPTTSPPPPPRPPGVELSGSHPRRGIRGNRSPTVRRIVFRRAAASPLSACSSRGCRAPRCSAAYPNRNVRAPGGPHRTPTPSHRP